MGHNVAVFLDRDGVLTRERVDYTKTPEELEILPGIFGPLQEIRKHGFKIVVVTNQSVVGRGLTTIEGLERIHVKLREELSKHGCAVDAIYYCPHLPSEGCECRKPAPGLILRAAREFEIDMSRSWMIGDKEIDMEAARRAGCRGLMVTTNTGYLDAVAKEILGAEDTTLLTGGQ